MPVMAIYRRNDVSAELYDAYRAKAPIYAVPKGALAHVHGRAGVGFVSIDVWEDAAAMEAYIQDVIIPATVALGIEFERPEILEVSTFITTPGAEKFLVPFIEPAAALT